MNHDKERFTNMRELSGYDSCVGGKKKQQMLKHERLKFSTTLVFNIKVSSSAKKLRWKMILVILRM